MLRKSPRIPPFIIVALWGLVAAFVLLIALTGKNVSSSMEIVGIIGVPGKITAMPSVHAIPTLAAIPKIQPASPAPSPSTTGVQTPSSPPESIPGLVRVTLAPTPTSVPEDDAQIQSDQAVIASTVATSSPVSTTVPATSKHVSPIGWIVPALFVVMGALLIVVGIRNFTRRP